MFFYCNNISLGDILLYSVNLDYFAILFFPVFSPKFSKWPFSPMNKLLLKVNWCFYNPCNLIYTIVH